MLFALFSADSVNYHEENLHKQLATWRNCHPAALIVSLTQSECFVPNVGVHVTVLIVYTEE